MSAKVLVMVLVIVVLSSALTEQTAEAGYDEQLFGEPYPAAASVQGLPTYYRVEVGDTLWDIAGRYGVRPDVIAQTNGLSSSDLIYAGQYIVIPAGGLIHRVVEGDTLWEIATYYGVALEELLRVNSLGTDEPLMVGAELLIPVTFPELALDVRGERDSFSWPVLGPITSPFGMRDGRLHEGLDIAADAGTPVRAAADGRVVCAGPAGTYGLLVILTHRDGWATYYAHCDRITVTTGQAVSAGQLIGTVGSTGHSTGPHLHFEVRLDGVPYDPGAFLP
ncbi:MAG: M23 family metallopeptidase [Bacillota bacterium]